MKMKMMMRIKQMMDSIYLAIKIVRISVLEIWI